MPSFNLAKVIMTKAQGLLPLYKNTIEQDAERASDRRDYNEIAKCILKMSETPGGGLPALQLANHLMEKYNKRPAMKDELKKCLFL